MRSILVSTEVYAAIWAAREAGEEDEDAVLRRLLKAGRPAKAAGPPSTSTGIGVTDGRSGTHFHEGFEIFRNYKGREYRAAARNGQWIRQDNGQSYRSLNRLNSSIVAGQENVWNGNWKYRHANGQILSIDTLRH